MGLSETERTRGIFHHIKQIHSIGSELPTEDIDGTIPHIKELCSGLWHDFLGKSRNPSHWILGSSAENKVTVEASSPWGIAVLYGIQEVCEKKNIFDEMLEKFDVKNHLQILPILQGLEDKNLSRIYEIYHHLESVIYNLRRYDDRYLENLGALSKTVSNLMGLCYTVFVEEKEFCAKAYLLHYISEMLLLYPYAKDMETEKEKMDAVCRIFDKFNLVWHYISCIKPTSRVDLQELCRIYRELLAFQRAKTLNSPEGIEARLFALLKLCYKGLGSGYARKEITNILSEKKVKYDKKKLESLLKICEEDSKTRSKESIEEYSKAQDWAEDYMFKGLDE